MTQSVRGSSTYFLLMLIICSYFLVISQQQNEKVYSLVYRLQNKYCGQHFCTKDPSFIPPLCKEDIPQEIVDSDNGTSRSEKDQGRPQIAPPCSKCSCDDSCSIYGTCCADKYMGAEYYFDCHEIYLNFPRGFREDFLYVVSKCLPDAPNYNKNLEKQCEHGQLGYIQDGRLVTAPHSYGINVTFRNKYCAMCYNVHNYTPWNVYVSCSSQSNSLNYSNINSLIRSVEETQSCLITTALEFGDGMILPFPHCAEYRNFISTCNVTGLWQEYNDTIVTACQSYLNPALNYRNIFCAMCNGLDETSLACSIDKITLPDIRINIRPFSAILNFENSDLEVIKGGNPINSLRRLGEQEEYQCRKGDVFDPVSKKCREEYCPLVGSSDNDTCIQLDQGGNTIVITCELTISFLDDVFISLGSSHSEVGNHAILSLETKLNEYGFMLYDSVYTDYAGISVNQALTIRESRLKLGLLNTPHASLEMSVVRLEGLANMTMNITWMGQVVNMQIGFDRNPNNRTNLLRYPSLARKYLMLRPQSVGQGKDIMVPLSFNLSCPMYQFESDEVLVVNNTVFVHGTTKIDPHKYFVTDEEIYFICSDVVFQSDENKIFVEPRAADPEQIVTLVCISCSLLFLLLTLIVYSMIKGLHTLPGLNLIFLTFSLFVAQALYLFGAGAVANSTACIATGVVIHYFWLVAFAWMNVCCFHMFRVFNNLFSSLDFVHDKKYVLIKYSLFAYCVPLVIIIITVSSSYILSNHVSIGYGGSSLCFVSPGLVSVFAFGVPAGVTVIANTILLIYTIISLRRNKNEQRGNEESVAGDISKFFKLSTLTGVSWLFGFLGYFFKRVELMYVFTVLSAGQGLFIFLSFVVSKRILKMVRDRMKRGDRGKTKDQHYSDITSHPVSSASPADKHILTSRL